MPIDIADPQFIGVLPILFLACAAFVAGLLDSMAGGGGLVSLPATLLVGIPPHLALGTGKFMAAIGTSASFLTYARSGVMVWRVVAIGVGFSFIGSIAGSETALHLDNAVLGKVILFLLPVAAALTFVPVRGTGREKTPGKLVLYVLTPVICTLIGFYDGFFGPGTGSFMLLALHFFLGLHLVAASGTAKAFNLASNISGLAVFFINGKIYYYAAVPMAIANVAGNVLGSRLALKRGPALIRRMLLISLALLFASLIWRYYAE